MAGNWEPGSSHKLGDILDVSLENSGLIWEPLESLWNIDVEAGDVGETANSDSGSRKSIKEALLNLQRAWEIIENVSEISSTVLVNKFQCERIADHFRRVAKLLEDIGLDEGFAGCHVLDGGLMRFSITGAGMPSIESLIGTKRFALSSFTHGAEHRDLNFPVNDESTVVTELVEFIGKLLKILIEGRDLVLIHKGLKEVNNEIVDKTGLHGERFMQLHRELDELLRRHSVQPVLTRSFKPDYDSTLIYYLNSNCLGGSEHLSINFNTSPNVDLANALAKMLERPDSVLKGLTICKSKSEEPEAEKLISSDGRLESKCRSTVIEALSRSTKLVHFRIEATTDKDVHELYSSLAANKVLEELDLEFSAIVQDVDAKILSAMLERNQSVKILRLWCPEGIDLDGAVFLREMLAVNSTLEELIVSGDGGRHTAFGGAIPYLIRPLKADGNGESPVNTSLRRLTIDGIGIWHQGASAVAQMLRTNKSLLYFAICNEMLGSSEAREILKSLENNRTLQELRIDKCTHFDVQIFKDLLVKHNFTLKTICLGSERYSIEDFIELVLKPLATLGKEYVPLWYSRHVYDQDIVPKPSEELVTESCKSPSTNMDQILMEPTIERIRRLSSNSGTNCDIFLSYSEDGRDFAKQLYLNLKASNYNLLNDPNSSNIAKEELSGTSIFKAIEQSQLAIIVLSKGYLTSKQSMLELSRIVKRKKTSDSTLKVFPLFYKLTLSDLDAKKVEVEWVESWKLLVLEGKVEEEEIGFWNEALKVIFDEKSAQLEKAKALLKDLIHGKIKVQEFCTLFSEACDALDFKNYDNSEVEYLLAVVENIKNIIPLAKEWKSDQMLGYVSMLEMQSELSLQMMTSLLKNEPLLKNQFILQRALNKGEYLQHKYIEWNTFEAKDEQYSKGCITAALFPKAFLYQFKAQVLYGALSKASNFHDNSCLPMLMGAATEVAKKWKDLCRHEHQPIYIDIEDSIDVECVLSHRGIVATCKNFHEGEEVGKDLQTGIVQDDLTGVYCCGRINSSTLGGPIHSEAIGVFGVKVTSTDVYVEDMREDGSYYSGTLKDFAYELGLDQMNDDFSHKQCATKAFGDLEGTSFLKENCGIKCSPLLIIALKSASQRKGLKLTWNEKYGHMEIEHGFQAPKLKGNECQILFTDHVKELGVAIKWGNNSLAALQASVYGASVNDKMKGGVEVKVGGTGATINFEKQSSKGKKLMKTAQRKIQEANFIDEGGFVCVGELDAKHMDAEQNLLQGALHESDLNYLVVYDNIREGHVSLFSEKDGAEEDELEWKTEIFLNGKTTQERQDIVHNLKGSSLTVERSGSTYTIKRDSESSRTGYFGLSLLNSKRKCIIKDNMKLSHPHESNDQWKHIIGLQSEFSGNKYFWEASFMQAIILSRTRFSSGSLARTETLRYNGDRIGYWFQNDRIEGRKKYMLDTDTVITKGKFSKAPASQVVPQKIKWGGENALRPTLENVPAG